MARFLIVPHEGDHFIVNAPTAVAAAEAATKDMSRPVTDGDIEAVRKLDNDGRSPAFTMYFEDSPDDDTFITHMSIHKSISGQQLMGLLKQGVRGMIESGMKISGLGHREVIGYIFDLDDEQGEEAEQKA